MLVCLGELVNITISSTMALPADLPDGFTREIRTFTRFEFRCPCPKECGKGTKLLYKKATMEAAQTQGAWHLWDTEKHPTRNCDEYDISTWELCRLKAIDGVGQAEHEYEATLDQFGDEVDKPHVEKGFGKGQKKKGEGKVKDEEEGNDPWSPHGGSPKPKRAARRAERERSPTHERDQDRGRDRERHDRDRDRDRDRTRSRRHRAESSRGDAGQHAPRTPPRHGSQP